MDRHKQTNPPYRDDRPRIVHLILPILLLLSFSSLSLVAGSSLCPSNSTCSQCLSSSACRYCPNTGTCVDYGNANTASCSLTNSYTNSDLSRGVCDESASFKYYLQQEDKFVPNNPEHKSTKYQSLLPVLCVLVFLTLVGWIALGLCRPPESIVGAGSGNQPKHPSGVMVTLALFTQLGLMALFALTGWKENWSYVKYPLGNSTVEFQFGLARVMVSVEPDGIEHSLWYSSCAGPFDEESHYRFCYTFWIGTLFAGLCSIVAALSTFISFIYCLYGMCSSKWPTGIFTSSAYAVLSSASGVTTWALVVHFALQLMTADSVYSPSTDFGISWLFMCGAILVAFLLRTYWQRVIRTAPRGTAAVHDASAWPEYPPSILPAVADTASYSSARTSVIGSQVAMHQFYPSHIKHPSTSPTILSVPPPTHSRNPSHSTPGAFTRYPTVNQFQSHPTPTAPPAYGMIHPISPASHTTSPRRTMSITSQRSRNSSAVFNQAQFAAALQPSITQHQPHNSINSQTHLQPPSLAQHHHHHQQQLSHSAPISSYNNTHATHSVSATAPPSRSNLTMVLRDVDD